MDVSVTKQLLEDISELPKNVEKKIRDLVNVLSDVEAKHLNNIRNGWNLKKLKSSPFSSVRLNRNYRVLIKTKGNSVYLHRAIDHDSYESERISKNDSRRASVDVKDETIKPSKVFEWLLSMGISYERSRFFKEVDNEDEFVDALVKAEEDVSELALSLYEASAIHIPKAKYQVISGGNELADLLNSGMSEEWKIYLHSSQEYIVNERASRRLFIKGDAGTGKTLCACHRAVRLQKKVEDLRIAVPQKTAKKLIEDKIESIDSQALDNIEIRCIAHHPNELVEYALGGDHLIVDEAQDFHAKWYNKISKRINDYERPKWGCTIFMDMNQVCDIQSNLESRYEDRVEHLNHAIGKMDYAVEINLPINYRNSREISNFFKEFVDQNIPYNNDSKICLFESGDVIEVETESKKEHENKLFSLVGKITNKYDPEELAIVPTRAYEEVKYKMEKRNFNVTEDPLVDRMLVTGPGNIRGFERRVVILYQADEYLPGRNIKRSIYSYLGMSRARDLLVIIKCKVDPGIAE